MQMSTSGGTPCRLPKILFAFVFESRVPGKLPPRAASPSQSRIETRLRCRGRSTKPRDCCFYRFLWFFVENYLFQTLVRFRSNCVYFGVDGLSGPKALRACCLFPKQVPNRRSRVANISEPPESPSLRGAIVVVQRPDQAFGVLPVRILRALTLPNAPSESRRCLKIFLEAAA